MQLGQNVPCKSEDAIQNLRGVESICANVTSPSQWCPESYNSQLREMLGGKTTWLVCNLYKLTIGIGFSVNSALCAKTLRKT